MKTIRALFFCAAIAAAADLPPKAAPGAIDPRVTQSNIKTTICKSGYTDEVRSVSESTKKEIYARDHKKPQDGVCCEIDHRLPLELGGLNAPENLWAELWSPAPGARGKDRLETAVKHDVCKGALTLKQGQAIFLGNWWTEYHRRFGAGQ